MPLPYARTKVASDPKCPPNPMSGNDQRKPQTDTVDVVPDDDRIADVRGESLRRSLLVERRDRKT